MSAFDQCREHGIQLKSYSLGEHRTTCPKCSHRRKKINQKVACLAVSIKPDCVMWFCHHCGESGGAKTDAETNYRPQRRRNESARSLYR